MPVGDRDGEMPSVHAHILHNFRDLPVASIIAVFLYFSVSFSLSFCFRPRPRPRFFTSSLKLKTRDQ